MLISYWKFAILVHDMKTITVNIPDDIYEELTRCVYIRQLCGEIGGIDFGILVAIINAIGKEWKEVLVSRKKNEPQKS